MAIPQEFVSHPASYIQELQELFAVYHAPFGHPEDLPTFAARLDTPGPFTDDVFSILRSIILREGGSFPHSELLEILILAIAGPGLDPASAPAQPAVRKLLSFVALVTRRPWNVPPDEPVPAEAPILVEATEPLARPIPPAAEPSESFNHIPRAAARFSNRPEQEPEITPSSEVSAEPALPPPPSARPSVSSAPLWIGAALALGLILVIALYSRSSSGNGQRNTPPVESISLPEPKPAPPPPPPETAPRPTADIPPAPPAAAKTARPPARAEGTPARFAVRPPPRPAPAPASPAASAASEPTPDAMLAAAAVDPEALEDSTAAPGGSRSALRGPVARGAHAPYFLVSSGIMASHLLESPEPGYPMMARLAHIGGQVILQAVISTEGEVIATRVLSGHRLLRGAATSAVKRWRYRPYILDGHPVNVATIITVDFHSHE